MPKQEGQKAKILVLLDIFQHQTDEDHPLSVPQLLAALAKAGVPAERKSVYADIEALRTAGYDIELQRGRGGGYYLASRTFQLAELKLLVDAVQASRFVTARKSAQLIKKLEGFTSDWQARQLHRQVFVSGRAKSSNDTAYYAVDALYRAIAADKMVAFQYVDWTLDRKKAARNGGAAYRVSPWALAWENNSYYLIAYEDYAAPFGIRHYRVDKMEHVRLLDEPRRGRKDYEAFDLAAYMQRMFNMYNGPEVAVTLRCENRLVGAMLDRFGTGVILIPEEDGAHFHLTVPATDSPQFLGWVCGFGTGVTVTAPESIREKMRALAARLAESYR